MSRIDEVEGLITENRKRCVELEDRLHEIRDILCAEESNIAELKKELLKAVLEDKYESGYVIYFVKYTYTYDDSSWTKYSTKIFDMLIPEGTVERYFYREANSYLKWNDLWGKAIYKIEYDIVFIHQLSNYDVNELLEELGY